MPYCCETVVQPNLFNKTKCKCLLNKYRYQCCVPPFSIQSYQRCSIVCPLERSKILNKQLCYSEKFRYFYDRGDLPCTIQHITKGQKLKWFIDDLNTLNIDYYLPIFIDGLCEIKYPYNFIAFEGVLNLIEHTSHKIDNETLSKLIHPLKRALYTNNPVVIKNVLIILEKLARGNDGAIGISLVSYYNQLLPIINILKERYQQKFSQCQIIDNNNNNDLVRLIDQTLIILEQFGGPDAFINIKYIIPTYEQQADVKQLTSSQMNTFIRPLMNN